jgi:enoyl-CoA hydratase/carnithine racemase
VPVVIAGREGRFSGGFDLSVFSSGDAAEGVKMLREGFSLSARLLSFPAPVVVACTGHAIAMGVFLMVTGRGLVQDPGERIGDRYGAAAGGVRGFQAAAHARARASDAGAG